MPDLFTLEAVFAKKGDALILHYGPEDDPSWMLIDGGPGGVYRNFLRPRLDEIKAERNIPQDDPFPLRMVMVSHIDDDHINGVLQLCEDVVDAIDTNQPRPFAIETMWHNAFDDLLDNDNDEIVSRMAATVASNDPAGLPVPTMDKDAAAVIQSTRQGRNLRKIAERLRSDTGLILNEGFDGKLIMSPDDRFFIVEFENDLNMMVIGPDKSRIVEYQKKWDKDLKKILEKEENAAEAASFKDRSAFNLASICVVASIGDKRMLLTGDARGDFLQDWIEGAGLLDAERHVHFDIFKLPHHGSDRNVKQETFEMITADHYIVSGDGEHGNPELDTLRMLGNARQNVRADERFTVHFTITEDQHEHETDHERKEALERVIDWVENERPANCDVVFRKDGDLSVSVSL